MNGRIITLEIDEDPQSQSADPCDRLKVGLLAAGLPPDKVAFVSAKEFGEIAAIVDQAPGRREQEARAREREERMRFLEWDLSVRGRRWPSVHLREVGGHVCWGRAGWIRVVTSGDPVWTIDFGEQSTVIPREMRRHLKPGPPNDDPFSQLLEYAQMVEGWILEAGCRIRRTIDVELEMYRRHHESRV